MPQNVMWNLLYHDLSICFNWDLNQIKRIREDRTNVMPEIYHSQFFAFSVSLHGALSWRGEGLQFQGRNGGLHLSPQFGPDHLVRIATVIDFIVCTFSP